MASGIHYNDEKFLEDLEVTAIKNAIPELISFHRDILDCLWCDFSTTWYCAGGLGVDSYHIEQFRRYLLTDNKG